MKKILISVCSLVVVISLLFTGCGIGNYQVYYSAGAGFHNVFRIGSMKCPQKEALIYLENYKNLYGKIGDTDLWDGDFDSSKIQKSIKQMVLEHLSKVYALNMYAKDHDITLDETEMSHVKDASREDYDSLSKEERSYAHVSEKDITKMYVHYALAQKVYFGLMNHVDEEVSDDEARVMDAYVLYVTDEDLSKEIAVKIKNGASFERLVSTYSEKDKGIVTFGRGTYPKKVEDVVFYLDDKEVSPCISSDGGYYFIYCINKYDEKLSEANKKKIIEERKKQVIDEIITKQNKKYYSCVNKNLWEHLEMNVGKDIKTETFFSTLDKYLSYDS